MRMALDMLEAVSALARALDRPVDVRIGVHTGPVVAGVIGTSKFIYDLWGDTVNVASRLEFHGLPGAVQMSEATWLRSGGVIAERRGPIELKGRGTVVAFVAHRPASDIDVPRKPTKLVDIGGSVAYSRVVSSTTRAADMCMPWRPHGGDTGR